MARPKKQRDAEVQKVFENLKYCKLEDLNEVIRRATELIDNAKKVEIEQTEKAIEELTKKLEELKK